MKKFFGGIVLAVAVVISLHQFKKRYIPWIEFKKILCIVSQHPEIGQVYKNSGQGKWLIWNIDQPLDQKNRSLLDLAIEYDQVDLAFRLIGFGALPSWKKSDRIDRFCTNSLKAIEENGISKEMKRVSVLLELSRKIDKQPLSKEKSTRIPKKIHQIWIGPQPLPDKFKEMVTTWKSMHPDWEYKLWTNEDLETIPLKNQKAFDLMPNWGAKSDILRYEILANHGGVYVDIDFESLRPLDNIHESFDFYSGEIGRGWGIANGVIGCSKNHPIMESLITEIGNQDIQSTEDYEEILEKTGPNLLTKVIAQYLCQCSLKDPLVCIFPKESFFPFPAILRKEFWGGKISRDRVLKYCTQDTYAVHYWGTSWQEKK